MFKNVVCPVSTENVNSNVSRLTVFINAALMMVFLITLQPIPLIIVLIDTGIRALAYTQYSPLYKIASLISNALKWQSKMVNKAPKIFASRLGFICAFLGCLFVAFHSTNSALFIIGLFATLAILDSVFDFCVGCLIYHHLVYPYYKNN